MRYEDLPERWRQKLKEYLTAKNSLNKQQLSASDFPTDTLVQIDFEDGSTVAFQHAFFIKAKEVAVFTEHCGYHIFPFYDGLNLTMKSSRDASAGSA